MAKGVRNFIIIIIHVGSQSERKNVTSNVDHIFRYIPILTCFDENGASKLSID